VTFTPSSTSTATFTPIVTPTPTLTLDTIPPIVKFSTRVNTNPINLINVDFLVTFSEPVSQVDITDYSLATIGVTGASITSVSGNGYTYNVKVNTGAGNGTIRLDVVDDNTIIDAAGNPLGGVDAGDGNFTSGQTYTIKKTPTFSDVPVSNQYFTDIEILYANGLTGGCAITPLKFCPNDVMNRGQAAVFMLRGNFGSGFVPNPSQHIFMDDWKKGTWAEPWAEAMYSKGLSAGCLTSPLKYCPWDQIPREQAVIFALRLKYGNNYTPPPATGTLLADMKDVGYYATSWAEQAYKDGLIPPCGSSGGKPKICPREAVSRGLGAYMIVRAKNLTMP